MFTRKIEKPKKPSREWPLDMTRFAPDLEDDEEFEPPPPMDTSHIERKWLGVAYADQSAAQKLDIYLPDKGDGPFPVVVTIHGGAWMFGDKGDIMNLHFLEGLKRNFAVVCMNYRLSGEAKFPKQIHDCKAAIRYLRANAEKYCLDVNRIAAWGASAGAHLAALLGTSRKVRKLEDFTMGNPLTSSAVHAVVDWYGPTENFLKMDEQLKASGMGEPDHSSPDSPESLLLGQPITEVPDLVRFASPMTYIKANMPPFLIQHGLKDEVVPVQQSLNFAAEIEKATDSKRVTLELIKDATHGDPLFESPQNVAHVLDFIEQHLKPPRQKK
jgi:acetyl esterase/lipase